MLLESTATPEGGEKDGRKKLRSTRRLIIRNRIRENRKNLGFHYECLKIYLLNRIPIGMDTAIFQESILTLIQVCSDLREEETFNRETRALISAAKELNLKSGLIVTGDDERHITLDGIEIEILPLYKYILSRE